MGAEQQIKRKMIDIIYRVSAGLKGLESQGSPLKKRDPPTQWKQQRQSEQMIDTIILLRTFNEPQLLIWRGYGRAGEGRRTLPAGSHHEKQTGTRKG